MIWLARSVYLLRNSWTVAPCCWAARTFRPRSNALHSVNSHESNPQYYVPLINRNVDPFSWIIYVCLNLIFVSFPRDVVSSFSSSCFCTPDLRRLIVCSRSTRQYNSHAYTGVQLVFAAKILRQARRGNISYSGARQRAEFTLYGDNWMPLPNTDQEAFIAKQKVVRQKRL